MNRNFGVVSIARGKITVGGDNNGRESGRMFEVWTEKTDNRVETLAIGWEKVNLQAMTPPKEAGRVKLTNLELSLMVGGIAVE
jgi:hypothetical protein